MQMLSPTKDDNVIIFYFLDLHRCTNRIIQNILLTRMLDSSTILGILCSSCNIIKIKIQQ